MGKAQKLTLAARAAGLPPALVYDRVHKHGWSLRRALSVPIKTWSFRENGLSQAERARQAGLDPSVVHSRLKRGWSKEAAFTSPLGTRVMSSRPGKLMVNAVATRARAHGLKPGVVFSRVARGASIDAALTTPLFSTNIARDPSPAAGAARISNARCKLIASKLLGAPIGVARARRLITDLRLAGIGETVKSRAEKAGINIYTVRARIARGWSVERALQSPVQRRTRAQRDDLRRGLDDARDDV
jgi:lambda repressor-like predicted transcriptional regulator